MAYKNFSELFALMGCAGKRKVVVAGADDEHTLEAVLKAESDGQVDYLLVGPGEKIAETSRKLGYTAGEDKIIEMAGSDETAAKAVELVREGQGDFLMKGKIETSTLLKAVVNRETGIAGGGVMFHLAILEVPAYHKLLAITDGGMILAPDIAQKQAILKEAVSLFHRLDYECPKVGVMAATEAVNAKMPATLDGAELKRMAVEESAFGRCLVEGPISFDLAVSRESAAIKGYQSPVAGDVDIMLMPDIVSGNLTAKGLYCLGGAKMAGCIMGARAPIVLSSRGASFEEKYISLLLSATLAGLATQERGD